MTGEESLVHTLEAVGVRDPRVLDAVRGVPRARFVPPAFAAHATLDEPVPIPHEQVTTQPSLSARMVEGLHLSGRERVLEVGTGYGYQTALLAYLAAHVVSVERFGDLAERARRNLARQGVDNVEVVVGDGSEGVPSRAPYDAVLVSAAFPEVPAPLVEQLRVGGRLVQPIGSGGAEEVVAFERVRGGLERRETLTMANFVRLYGRHGFRE